MQLFEESQGSLNYPQSLTEAYKPKSISEFVGLAKHKSMLEKLIANPRPCALLFLGGPGSGKTTMAFAYARAIGAEIHHVPSQECTLENLQRISDMCHYVPMAGVNAWHIVIVDEADLMSPAAQTFLLSRLDGSNPCPRTIWILTANSDERLAERFLSRLIKFPAFNGYGNGKEARELLARIWRDRAAGAPEPDFSRIPTGNIREALQALESELLAI